MRKLVHPVLLLVLITSLTIASEYPQESKYRQSTPSAKRLADVDGRESVQKKGPVKIVTQLPSAAVPGTKVGETAYNYQTNDNLHDRIYYNQDGTIHVQWMYGDIAETPVFPGRRMYYDFYDGSKWVNAASLGVPIENERAGYGSLAVNPENVAYPASHHTITNEEATNLWYDFMPGFGFFTQAPVWQARANDLNFEPFWPDVAVDELGTIYVTATNNNQDDWVSLINNVNDNILFWKSVDNGASWSDWYAMFPDTTTYPLGSGASGPSEAGSHQIAVSDAGDGKVGVLVADTGHDFYFFESNDRGDSWQDAIKIIGNEFPDPEDSLTYPILWDVAVEYDSLTGAPIDTFLTVFTGSENEDTGVTELEPNIRPRPHGPADLFYLNGEPHVVWNETIWTDESSYYPNGYGHYWTSDRFSYLDGSDSHEEGGFSIKHWSPSTGVSIIYKRDATTDVWPGTFQQYVTMPQIGADADGNLYCLFTKYSDTDTLLAEDDIKQAETQFGPLSFGRIWGAKSTDGGATWMDATQLIPEEDCIHQNLRYIGVADYNDNDAIHIVYQNTPGVPGVPIGQGADHSTWANAEIKHWAVPTFDFPTTDTPMGPEIALETSSKLGGLDFGDIGDAGEVSKTFIIKNTGDQDLEVTGIFAGDKTFVANPATFTVAPGAAQEVTVTFTPHNTDTLSTFLAIPNNDPTEGSIGIPVEGVGQPVGVAENAPSRPARYELAQNYPNPFNPTTTIEFSLAADKHVRIAVFNTLGEQVDVILDTKMTAGTHKVQWTPKDLSSGVYFYRIVTDVFRQTQKMILMQ